MYIILFIDIYKSWHYKNLTWSNIKILSRLILFYTFGNVSIEFREIFSFPRSRKGKSWEPRRSWPTWLLLRGGLNPLRPYPSLREVTHETWIWSRPRRSYTKEADRLRRRRRWSPTWLCATEFPVPLHLLPDLVPRQEIVFLALVHSRKLAHSPIHALHSPMKDGTCALVWISVQQ